MRRALAALSLVLVLGACADADPSPPTQEDLGSVDMSPDHTITVDEDGFHPAELTITAGEIVLLVNEGEQPHSFTGTNQELGTGILQPGDETTLVLTEPNEITYYDGEDPDHEGTLVVEPQ